MSERFTAFTSAVDPAVRRGLLELRRLIGEKVSKVGDTMTGDLTITNGAPQVYLIDDNAAANRGVWRVRANNNFTIEARNDDLSARITPISIDTDTGAVSISSFSPWINVTFENSWINYGGNWQDVQYRKVGDIVQVRGLARHDGTLAGGNVMFTLPVGFRAPAWQILSAYSGNIGSSGNRSTRVNIGPGGGFVAAEAVVSGISWISFHHSYSTLA